MRITATRDKRARLSIESALTRLLKRRGYLLLNRTFEEVTSSLGNTWTGRYLSPEHRARISRGKRGRSPSPEHRASIGAALRRRPQRSALMRDLADRDVLLSQSSLSPD